VAEPDNGRRQMGLPDRRKNTYENLEKKLDHHLELIEARFERWFRRGLIAFAVTALCSGAALVGFWINLGEIKETRETYVRTSCEATNKRNSDTSGQLTALAQEDADQRKTQAGKDEVYRRRDVTLALIDALQPHQNCNYEVKLAEGEATPTPTPRPPPKP
jgi:hypothetical protein